MTDPLPTKGDVLRALTGRDDTAPSTATSRTLHVMWHEDAIRGAVDRALAVTMATEADQPCTIEWIDLACLVDMGRTWIREQEAS